MVRASRKIELALQGNEKYLKEMSETLSFYVYKRALLILTSKTRKQRLTLLGETPEGVRDQVKYKVEELWNKRRHPILN